MTLKRFIINQDKKIVKLDNFVDVPLDEVDFAPYFAPDSPFKNNNKYKLYAVINHTGR